MQFTGTFTKSSFASFGGAATFGGAPAFGGSPTKVFGQAEPNQGISLFIVIDMFALVLVACSQFPRLFNPVIVKK